MVSIYEKHHAALMALRDEIVAQPRVDGLLLKAFVTITATLNGANNLMQPAPYPPARIVIPGPVQLCGKPGRFGHPCYELKDHEGGCQ